MVAFRNIYRSVLEGSEQLGVLGAGILFLLSLRSLPPSLHEVAAGQGEEREGWPQVEGIPNR